MPPFAGSTWRATATGVITIPAAVEKILSAGIVTVIPWVSSSADEVGEDPVFGLAGEADDWERREPGAVSAFGSGGLDADAGGMVAVSFGRGCAGPARSML